jgi:two-component sensor histidine kinase
VGLPDSIASEGWSASTRDREALYKSALAAGRMGAWETDLVKRTRTWSPEGMALFGLSLPDGRGTVGGPDDEYWRALHPDDRGLMAKFHAIAQKQDSFAAEYRIVLPNGITRWVSGRGMVMDRGSDGSAMRMVSIVADITERKAAEDHVKFLLSETAHRSKNLMTVISAVAKRTAANSKTLKDFDERFQGRLQAMARSQDLLVRQDWRSVSLKQLISHQLEAFLDTTASRLVVNGEDLDLSPEAAEAIGLALHELATNAVKHGSLASPTGRIDLAWQIKKGETLELVWKESGAAASPSPTRQGFGHVVLTEMISRAVNGSVEIGYSTGALSWTLQAPLSSITSQRE